MNETDLINRQHVIDCLMGVIGHLRNEVPSVEPELKKGTLVTIGFLTSACSACGAEFHELEYTNFCPRCGARLE